MATGKRDVTSQINKETFRRTNVEIDGIFVKSWSQKPIRFVLWNK